VLADFAGPVVSSVHDLYLACPNFSLLYKKLEACGIPDDLSVCERCLETIAVSPMPGAAVNRGLSLPYLETFRTEVVNHLNTVDHWVFATQSAADYFLRAYEPELDRVHIIEHGATIELAGRDREPDEAVIFDEPLRVGFAGLGWAKKGLLTVNELAEAFRDSSVELHHFGAMKETASPAVHAHGPYDNEYLPELLRRAGIQVVLLPGAYAETFGIVMSEALAAGLPVIGAHYGALGERIRAHGVGWTIDPMDVDGIRALIEHLDRCRDEVMRATREAAAVRLFPVEATAHRYAQLYDDGASTAAATARASVSG
jgi:glycosyltransferase involved in cell wall biosynthesis